MKQSRAKVQNIYVKIRFKNSSHFSTALKNSTAFRLLPSERAKIGNQASKKDGSKWNCRTERFSISMLLGSLSILTSNFVISFGTLFSPSLRYISRKKFRVNIKKMHNTVLCSVAFIHCDTVIAANEYALALTDAGFLFPVVHDHLSGIYIHQHMRMIPVQAALSAIEIHR